MVEDELIPVEDHQQFRVSTYKTKTELEPYADLCQEIKAVKVAQPAKKTMEYEVDRAQPDDVSISYCRKSSIPRRKPATQFIK